MDIVDIIEEFEIEVTELEELGLDLLEVCDA